MRSVKFGALGAALALAFAIGAGTSIPSIGASLHHDHSMHSPMPIPADWTDEQVRAFIAESDRKIDLWAGRSVTPGEKVIQDDGLVFTKSTPEMVAQRQCKWCPKAKKCH